MSKRNLAIFVATALVSGSLFTAGLANAWETRRAASYCNAGTSASSYSYDGRNNASFTILVGCAMPDESDLLHPQITHLNFHVDLPTTSTSLSIRCVNFFNVTGGSCSDAGGTPGGPGTFSMSPPNSPPSFAANWNNAAHFAYGLVFLSPNQQLKGMYTSNL